MILILKLYNKKFFFCRQSRDWNRFYDNRIYRKSIRIDFKIDYRIKSNLLIMDKFNDGHLIN